MELIDREKLKSTIRAMVEIPNEVRVKVLGTISREKAVDAEEVVRCKDCKHYTEQKKRCDHPCQDWDVECYDQWLEMEPSDFCSYGERRTGE